jgi:anaerobic selenocysteine-containing dehydrogenase
MIEKGFWMDDHFAFPSWDTMFTTNTGRFEFNGEKVDTDPWKATPAAEGDNSTFPLILVPYDSIRLASGSIGNPPFMMKIVADTVLVKNDIFVEINPETARKYQLSDGQLAILTTPKGEVTVRIHLFEGIMPGLVAMPTGLGHTGFDDFLAGKGVNVNELIGPLEDAASGFDAAWGIRAKLAKA